MAQTETKLQGRESGIMIRRDSNGVPHVFAQRQADLLKGLGYCHARDRGLQMLIQRSLAQGRTCEQLDGSDEMLEVDRFFRRLNLRRDADREIAKLSEPTLECVRAYCEGVNEFFSKKIPWELRLRGFSYEEWTLEDSILVLRLTAYVTLAQSQGDVERLFVEMVQGGVPRGHLEELFPGLLDSVDFSQIERIRLGERLLPESVKWKLPMGPAAASNNWVLAGSKTSGGSALLANDPHLEFNRLPAVWNEVVLETGERYCIAATMPGLPGTPIGRSNDLAWGATYTFMDAIDSWMEDCRDGCYRRDYDGEEKWEPFAQRRERVLRRGGDPVDLLFYENCHGVLDGDPGQAGLYLATQWASRTAGARTLESSMRIFYATEVEEGMDILGPIESAWNWVLADRKGNIGYQMSGLSPIRGEGCKGFAPLQGWNPQHDWRGFADYHDLPRELNPQRGFIATANEDLNHLGHVKPITIAMGSYRSERIAALLEAWDDWTPAGVSAMHMDVYSLQAERFMAVLRPLLGDLAGEHARAVTGSTPARVLAEWDCCYDLESRGAVLFEKFYRDLLSEVFGATLGPEPVSFLLRESGIPTDFYANFDQVLLDAGSCWYGGEGRDAVFKRVAETLLNSSSTAASDETWGQQQTVTMHNIFFGGRLPAFCGFDHGPLQYRGGRATIHQGQIYRLAGRLTSFGPSYRLVTDMGEDAAYTCLAGGPSDRRFSRWYKHGIADWLVGRPKRLRPER